jgi:hypothetical protein
MEQVEPHKNGRWIQAIRKGYQFLLY